MKRCLAIIFLSVFLITYFIPVTSVFATEVTWGDNNTYYITDTQVSNYKKIAVLDMVQQLTSSGVNELNINNADSIDEFVENFLDFIDENAQSTVSDIYSVCNEIDDALDEMGNYIGNFLNALGEELPNQALTITEMLSGTYNLPKFDVKKNPNYVPLLNRLSKLNQGSNNPTPSPNPDFSFIQNINSLYNKSHTDIINYYDGFSYGSRVYYPMLGSLINYTICPYQYDDFVSMQAHTNNVTGNLAIVAYTPVTINVITNNDNTISVIYSAFQRVKPFVTSTYNDDTRTYNNITLGSTINNIVDAVSVYDSDNGYGPYNRDSFDDMSTCINYIYKYYCNVNLYVDGIPWALTNAPEQPISIDINGIDFYSDTHDKPIEYYYPKGTQIDYQKLYLVIKKAIDDIEPINQTTINEGDVYYDSHDNVYSPVIYNYYSDDDSEDEEDVLSDILTLAVIPKFDTALLDPIEDPLTNGTVVMFTGAQVFPNEILFVLGAAFVLILFVAMINRLIE